MAENFFIELSERFIVKLEAWQKDPSQRLPWICPWNKTGLSGDPINPTTGRSYSGMNRFILWLSDFPDPRWCGYGQAQEQGWQVRKGEKATTICRPRITKNDDGTVKITGFSFSKVFNTAQMDGPPALVAIPDVDAKTGYEKMDEILSTWPVKVTYGFDKAAYSPSQDSIMMPAAGQFHSLDRYWATLSHEIAHSTGHSTRLDRKLSYAQEELVAEMTAGFVCGHAGILVDSLMDENVAYLDAWIRNMRSNPDEIRKVLGYAEAAFKMIIADKSLDE